MNHIEETGQIPQSLGTCDFCNAPVRVNGAQWRRYTKKGELHYAHLRCLSKCVGGKFTEEYQKYEANHSYEEV